MRVAETVFWVSPDGDATELDVPFNVRERWAPPAEFIAERVPGQAGARLREVIDDVHDFALPFWVDGADEEDLRTQLRSLVAAMHARRGNGRIRVIAPGGDSREITCRVVSGLGLSEVLGSEAGINCQLVDATFRAHDPYWYAATDTALVFTRGEPTPFFPIFPIVLSAADVFVDEDIDNGGDLETWPVWTIGGPATDITATNITTGKRWVLLEAVQLGQSVTIDTRPGAKTVTRVDDEVSLFASLTPLSELWPLERGVNQVQLAMSGTTDDSSLRLAYRPRYVAP